MLTERRASSVTAPGSRSPRPSPLGIERVVVINDDATASGGAATIALASATALAGRGVAVSFLTGDAAPSPLEHPSPLANHGIEVVRLGGRHLLDGPRAGAAMRGLYDPQTRNALQSWIGRNDTERTVYHLHNWHKYLSPSVFAPLKRVEARLLLSLHDFFLVCPNGGFFVFPEERACACRPMGARCLSTACDKRSVAHKAWRTLRQMVRAAVYDLGQSRATFLAVHDGMIELLERGGLSRERIRVLQNPVTPWLDDRCAAEANRDVLYVGRLEADKGVHVLAEAARLAGCRLHVVGDGPLREKLAAGFPEVEFHGRRDRQGIGAIARNARLVAVPTLVRETYGLVAMEALTSGIPVVISDTACIAREVAEAGMGVLCEAGSVASLARQFGALASDDATVERMSRTAFETARARIVSQSAWCDDLLRIYGETLARAGERTARAQRGGGLVPALPQAGLER